MALSSTPNGYLPSRHPRRLREQREWMHRTLSGESDLLLVIRVLLRYSLEPISYDFDALTVRERSIIGSPAMLARIKQFATEDTAK